MLSSSESTLDLARRRLSSPRTAIPQRAFLDDTNIIQRATAANAELDREVERREKERECTAKWTQRQLVKSARLKPLEAPSFIIIMVPFAAIVAKLSFEENAEARL